MRLIGTLSNENQARRISSYLKIKGIDSNCDLAFDAQTGQMTYHLWVLDEDRLHEAASDFDRFQKLPSDPEFDAPVALQLDLEDSSPAEEDQEKSAVNLARSPLTIFVIGLCFAIFLLNAFEELPMREENLSNVFMFTQVQSLLLYDLPPSFEALEKMVRSKQIVPGQKAEDLAPEVRVRVQELAKIPYWRGFTDWILLKLKGGDASIAEGPLFSHIRQGEVWRLFSPCILHSEFLHILFNMIWLWVLGRPIEQKIGISKTLILTAATGIGSNTIQYLMSGPFFIGYSGVVMGLAGFIWMRQRVSPWEGYPLNKMTILFLILFVGSMFVLSLASFFLQLFTTIPFAPNIANTAHIVGGVIGACLGRLSWFSWRAAK